VRDGAGHQSGDEKARERKGKGEMEDKKWLAWGVKRLRLCKELEAGMSEKEALGWVGKGVEIDGSDIDGMTPLMWACHMGMDGLARELLEKGANPKRVDVDEMGAELFAASAGYGACLEVVLDAMPDYDVGSRRAVEALLAAASAGHVECVRLLVGRGVAVDARGVMGMTALLCACRDGRAEMVDELLVAGADVGSTRDDGVGAGHLVAINGQVEVVGKLTDYGLDWFKLAEGKSALEMAQGRGFDELVHEIGKCMTQIERRACDEAAKRGAGKGRVGARRI